MNLMRVGGQLACLVLMLSGGVLNAEPTRFIDLAKATEKVSLGNDGEIAIYAKAGERGIRLVNSSAATITVRDSKSSSTIVMEPGMRMGLSCKSLRSLVFLVQDDIIYRDVSCGSMVRFGDEGVVR